MTDDKPDERAELRGKSYYYEQVEFYLNSGQLALALHQASRNIAYNEEDPVAYINRARVFEQLGQLERAILDLKKALRIAPDNQNALCFVKRLTEGR